MISNKRKVAAIFASAALATTFAACGDDDSDSGSSSGGATTTEAASPSEVKTDVGVTDREITLGVLTDTSGVFAGLGVPLNEGNGAYWAAKNAEGGVCGRNVVLEVKDHGYDPQKAVSLYREIEGDVLALNQLLGSPMTAALLPSLQSDNMLSVLAGWPSQLAANPNVIVAGATYDFEMINALDYMIAEGQLKRGDKIGHVYFEGEYGENAHTGVKYVAEQEGLEVVEQRIKATDQDLTAQVSSFKRDGVAAIAVSTGPTQLASLTGVAAAQGLDVPIAASGPAYDPALLETPAGDAIIKNVIVSTGTAPYSVDAPGVEEARTTYKEEFPQGTPKYSVTAGFAESRLMDEILTKACENGDLTREGLQTAVRQLTAVDLEGLVAGTLDFSKLGEPPTRSTYISKPDKDAEGGATVVGEPQVSKNAESYELEAG